MALTIQADDGDELSVHPLQLFAGEIEIRLQLQNNAYAGGADFDWITLTPDRARELGRALMLAADMIEPLPTARPSRVCN